MQHHVLPILHDGFVELHENRRAGLTPASGSHANNVPAEFGAFREDRGALVGHIFGRFRGNRIASPRLAGIQRVGKDGVEYRADCQRRDYRCGRRLSLGI